MILTITPNPSLDLLYIADRLVRDDANRIPEPRRRPGGQGINVARALIRLGAPAHAIALLGGPEGEAIRTVLADEGTPLTAVPAREPTRLFIAVTESQRRGALLLNSPGAERTAAEAELLLEATTDAIRSLGPAWVACCGSLPPGFPADFYATVAERARQAGARIVVDCDGLALRVAASMSDLLVPNRHEAARLLECAPIRTLPAAARAAARLLELGPRLAAVTLGPYGAVLATGASIWHARPPAFGRGQDVGAGDAFLAGMLNAAEAGADPAEVLRSAVATGSSVLSARGTDLVDPAIAASLMDQVPVRRVA